MKPEMLNIPDEELENYCSDNGYTYSDLELIKTIRYLHKENKRIKKMFTDFINVDLISRQGGY